MGPPRVGTDPVTDAILHAPTQQANGMIFDTRRHAMSVDAWIICDKFQKFITKIQLRKKCGHSHHLVL